MTRLTTLLPSLVVLALGAGALGLWLTGGLASPVDIGQPDEPVLRVDPGASKSISAKLPPGTLLRGPGVAPEAASNPQPTPPPSWPCFRGPNRDGISPDTTPLVDSFPDGKARQLWAVDVGEGHASPAVLNGRVYVMDYDQANSADALRCLSLADGQEIWRYSYSVKTKRNHGMSRTVPAVTDKYVVALGPKCHVLCLDAQSGKLAWGVDLTGQYGTAVPEWYAGQCPLIDGDRVILAPGGSALMIAADLATGKVLWQTPNPRQWNMTHTSVALAEIGGRKMYIYCGGANKQANTGGGVAGISAENGEILWETDAWQIPEAVVSTPVPLPDGKIFLAGGYGAGCMMLQVTEAAGKFQTQVLWRLKEKDFGAVQQTPVFYQGHIYGIRPDGQMACLDTSGKILWTSGSAKFGLGPFLIADGKMLAMNDSGLLTLAQFSPAGFKVLSQAKVLEGHDSWGPFSLAGGKLFARDLTRMVCLDLAK